MKTSLLRKLISLVDKHLFGWAKSVAQPASSAQPTAQATTKHALTAEQIAEAITEVTGEKPLAITTVTGGNKAAAQGKPDPNDTTKCDLCGQRKESVRSRKVITIGAKTRTLRYKFCDGCVATIGFQRMQKPPADADFLFYFDGEGEKVLVRPQNLIARDSLKATLDGDAAPWRWLGDALAIEPGSVPRLVHKLIAAGYKVIGEKSLLERRQLYVHEGKHCLYTAGAITDQVCDQILKSAGQPN